jgi:hypothetical protein
MAAESTLINGYQYDHADLTFKINGKNYEGGVKEIKYKTNREVGKLRGASPIARGRTRGTVDFEASIVLWKFMADQLIKDFGPGWMEKIFDIVVEYGNDDQPVTVDTLVQCTFLSKESGSSEGSDPNEVSFGLDPMMILDNGVAPMKGIKV